MERVNNNKRQRKRNRFFELRRKMAISAQNQIDSGQVAIPGPTTDQRDAMKAIEVIQTPSTATRRILIDRTANEIIAADGPMGLIDDAFSLVGNRIRAFKRLAMANTVTSKQEQIAQGWIKSYCMLINTERENMHIDDPEDEIRSLSDEELHDMIREAYQQELNDEEEQYEDPS